VGNVFNTVSAVCTLQNFTCISSVLPFRRSCIWSSQTMWFLSSHMKLSVGLFPTLRSHMKQSADPNGRAVYGVGLRPLACWDCGIESRRRHGCLSVMCVVWCQVDICASGWILVQRSPTDCVVSECDHEPSIMRRPWPTKAVGPW
jgi:hypothetical protein